MLALLGMDEIHTMNALKALLTTVSNGVAMLLFIVSHAVYWPETILMIVALDAGRIFRSAFRAEDQAGKRARHRHRDRLHAVDLLLRPPDLALSVSIP